MARVAIPGGAPPGGAPASAAAPGCLEDETVAAWIDGTLDGAELRTAEAHLALCAECRELVADAAFGALGTTARALGAGEEGAHADDALDIAAPGGPTAAESHLPFAGHVVADKYRIEGMLGRGGMGVLFAARDLGSGARVAIKVMNHQSRDSAARFIREAKIHTRLASPHVPIVHELGQLQDGAPYMVMEHLSGEDLAHVISRGPVPVPVAVDYVLQACNVLREAHALGIVHRDLKPANLFLVSRPGLPPLLKVLDFGVSKYREDDDTARAQSITATNSVLGSPLYMSPEQIKDSKHVDARADVWALGVILYQLATGRAPFEGRSFPALCLAIATRTPEPPSARQPGLPVALDAVVMRCLEKRAEDRLPSVEALALALRSL